MNVQLPLYKEQAYISSQSSEVFIRTTQNILELLAFVIDHNTNLFMLREMNFDPAFYDLSTGLAGEILQKFSNYSARAVLVGDYHEVKSKKLREFLVDSNQGSQVRFTDDTTKALARLIQEPRYNSLYRYIAKP